MGPFPLLFTPLKIKGAAHKNGDFNGTCEQGFIHVNIFVNVPKEIMIKVDGFI